MSILGCLGTFEVNLEQFGLLYSVWTISEHFSLLLVNLSCFWLFLVIGAVLDHFEVFGALYVCFEPVRSISNYSRSFWSIVAIMSTITLAIWQSCFRLGAFAPKAYNHPIGRYPMVAAKRLAGSRRNIDWDPEGHIKRLASLLLEFSFTSVMITKYTVQLINRLSSFYQS
jgi:hypothetical protein